MTTRAEYATLPVVQRLACLGHTPEDLVAAMRGQSDTTLSCRPGARDWSAKEVVCHLRDIEEQFILRFRTMLAMDDPTFLTLGDMPPHLSAWGLTAGDGLPLDPDLWAEERQYLRHDTGAALDAFGRRRAETLAFLHKLTPAQWQRGNIHLTLGRMTFDDWITLIAVHDANHVAQLQRALRGQP